jgi:hypothetical protein
MLSRWQRNGSVRWQRFRLGFVFQYFVEVPGYVAITNQLELLVATREATEVVCFVDAGAHWRGWEQVAAEERDVARLIGAVGEVEDSCGRLFA